jgi:DNA-binding NtrC family response regulator
MKRDDGRTQIVERDGQRVVELPRFHVRVIEGTDVGREATSIDGRLQVGSAEGVDLVLTDPTVSRFHLEIEATPQGIRLRDLGSTNGSFAGRLRFGEVLLRSGGTKLAVGRTKLMVELSGERSVLEASHATRFGGMLGASPAMRAVYARLAAAAPTPVPVLIGGETGSGKELAARAVHDGSPRRARPFEVVDCGGMPATLVESELFGHRRGAFTGAAADRIGAFERAHGGTLFLDELGELPLELQPKLLRVLAEGEVRPLGSHEVVHVDVRVVAATNRDLRREINAGRFRSDLYYRLAVIEVQLPPLRERLEDLPMLVRALLDTIADERGLEAHVEVDQPLLDAIRQHDWPGNIRELRNYLEQMLILQVPPQLGTQPAGDEPRYADLAKLPWHSAKKQMIERFEHDYLTQLLDTTDGNVAEAARRAGVDRGTLFRSMRRLGIKRDE